MKALWVFCFVALCMGSLTGGEFRVSGDGAMKVFYFGKDVALFRTIGMDMDGNRFWYTLKKAYYGGEHESASQTGDVSKERIVNNLRFLGWYPELQLIVGIGEIEANRPAGNIPVDWPSEYFCYSLDKDSLETFSDYRQLEAALKAKGKPLDMKSPEVFIEEVERDLHAR